MSLIICLVIIVTFFALVMIAGEFKAQSDRIRLDKLIKARDTGEIDKEAFDRAIDTLVHRDEYGW